MKIIWSDFTIENLKDIFDYYKIKASSKVAQKIRREILESTKLLIHNPVSGQIEFYLDKFKQNHRYLLRGNYKLIYRIERDKIFINDVFDVRQNPSKMIDKKRNNK
jgi:plasmid stabilization system protein ParE